MHGDGSKERVNRLVESDASTTDTSQTITCHEFICESIPNKALFGRADAMLSAASFDECVNMCADETRFRCKAGLYYENVRILSPQRR